MVIHLCMMMGVPMRGHQVWQPLVTFQTHGMTEGISINGNTLIQVSDSRTRSRRHRPSS